MNIDLSGKTALVTGGNVGIGAGISLALAECGAAVALTYYSHTEAAQETTGKIEAEGGQASVHRLDATKSTDVNATIEEVARAHGGAVDILVNNAGHLIKRVEVHDMTDAHWHSVLNVNLSSAFYCTRAVLPFMGEGGRIINMSSLAARNGGGPGAAAYATSKAAVIGFTRAMSKELASRGIAVNALAPGFIVDTPFHETFTGIENYEKMISGIPLGRAGTPDDVAGAVLYFTSDLGAWITGQVAEIYGGAWFV